MKKLTTIVAAIALPFLATAQDLNEPHIDKDIFNVCATILVIGLSMLFILSILQRVMDSRLKNKIVDKGIPPNVTMPLFKLHPGEQRESNIKWALLLAGMGAAFTIIHYTLPLGFHSLAIMTFCVSVSFLVYYAFLKKSGGSREE